MLHFLTKFFSKPYNKSIWPIYNYFIHYIHEMVVIMFGYHVHVLSVPIFYKFLVLCVRSCHPRLPRSEIERVNNLRTEWKELSDLVDKVSKMWTHSHTCACIQYAICICMWTCTRTY